MNRKTNTVRAILLDASECDRPEADHPATIEICADDLQRILERHITEPAQCLLQIAEPATAGTAVRVFRDYLGVHDGIKLGGHAMDDMALDLARIALNFPEALKGVRSEKPEPAPPQAVQVTVPSDAEIDAAIKAFDWEGWTDPEKAKRAFTREALSRWTAAAHPAKGVPAAIDPNECGQDVFNNGVSVGLFDIPKDTANAICVGISEATGVRLDWHYIAGRVHIKVLAATQPAAQPVATITGLDEFGPLLGWHEHWAKFPVGTNFYTQPAAQGMTEAARSVLAERARQIAAEGWTPEKDDAYNPGVLAEAGGIYALHAFDPRRVKETPEGWPWSPGWWKPKDPRTNLVKAGALILAEIERIDRTYAAQAKQGGA